LHERLGIKKDFTDWFKYHIKRVPLVECRDFILLVNIDKQDQWGGHNKVDYMIPFDIAKHLCMMSGVLANKKYRGRKATKNFLPLYWNKLNFGKKIRKTEELKMKTYKFCQSCSFPMNKDTNGGGTEKDGSLSIKYCSMCYKDGEFISPKEIDTPQKMQEFCIREMKKSGINGFFSWLATRGIPKLERWKE
jgi:phage anti-repressor protein